MFFLSLLLGISLSQEWSIQWNYFKKNYNKTYETESEEMKRFEIFVNNSLTANLWNQEHKSQVFGVTKFSDLTHEEFSSQILGGYTRNTNPTLAKCDHTCYSCDRFPEHVHVPHTLDWVSLGAVNPIRNQGHCGSCWAFSTIAALESAWFMKTGYLPKLSEEELVECAREVNYGCAGGEMQRTMKWLLERMNGSISDRRLYPYTSGHGRSGFCKWNIVHLSSAAQICDACYVSFNDDEDEAGMRKALAQYGVLSIGMNADHLAHYTGGILHPHECIPILNHAVSIVGFGRDETSGMQYWKVKNSWGPDWGESGYFRIKMGSNVCGVANDVSVAHSFGCGPTVVPTLSPSSSETSSPTTSTAPTLIKPLNSRYSAREVER